MLPYPSREKTEKSLNEFGQKFSAAVFSITFSGHGHDISAVESNCGSAWFESPPQRPLPHCSKRRFNIFAQHFRVSGGIKERKSAIRSLGAISIITR